MYAEARRGADTIAGARRGHSRVQHSPSTRLILPRGSELERQCSATGTGIAIGAAEPRPAPELPDFTSQPGDLRLPD